MITIIAQHFDRPNTGFYVPYVYLHGRVEEINHYDLVATSEKTVLPTGIHDVVVLIGKHKVFCKLFLWETKYYKGTDECKRFNRRGLIVAKSDKKYMYDAYKKYKAKEASV